MNRPFSAQDCETVAQMRAAGKTRREIADALGRTLNSVKHYLSKSKNEQQASATETEVHSDNENYRSFQTTEQIRTLDQLIRVCEIDLLEWEIERWICNKWEYGNRDGDVTPLFQVKVWLRRNSLGKTVKCLIDEFNKAAQSHKPDYRKIPKPAVGEHLAILPLPDAHFGKLCWASEVGADYDLKIAERLWKESANALLPRLASYGLETLVLVVGNDFVNSDNWQGATTSGTPQDNDGRPHKVITAAAMAFVWLIDQAMVFAPRIVVKAVPGNHDKLTSYLIAMYLSAWYRNYPNVEIDIEPGAYKWLEFGCNFIGLMHGDGVKLAEVPLFFATEAPEAWGRTTYREALTGHVHHETVKDRQGFYVRTCRSLTPPDAWHRSKLYGSRRGAEAWVYHKDTGPCGHLMFNVDRAA